MLLAYSWVFRLCCYAFSFLLGQSGERLILYSWPRHALDATLLASYWNFQHALGVFYSLNSRGLSDTFSLLCPGTCQHALDSWRYALGFTWSAFFLLLFVTHYTPTRSWCYALSFVLDQFGPLLMLRSWLRLRHSLDATCWTFSWNSSRCSWRYGPPQLW